MYTQVSSGAVPGHTPVGSARLPEGHAGLLEGVGVHPDVLFVVISDPSPDHQRAAEKYLMSTSKIFGHYICLFKASTWRACTSRESGGRPAPRPRPSGSGTPRRCLPRRRRRPCCSTTTCRTRSRRRWGRGSTSPSRLRPRRTAGTAAPWSP